MLRRSTVGEQVSWSGPLRVGVGDLSPPTRTDEVAPPVIALSGEQYPLVVQRFVILVKHQVDRREN